MCDLSKNESRAEKAKQLFLSGYNCTQSITVAFCDILKLTPETAASLSAGFGGGFGRLREVCGAFSGITMVLSAVYNLQDPNDRQKKAMLYGAVQSAAEKFKQQNRFLRCRDLLGIEKDASISPVPQPRTEEYYQKRPCAEIVKSAAQILEDILREEGVI